MTHFSVSAERETDFLLGKVKVAYFMTLGGVQPHTVHRRKFTTLISRHGDLFVLYTVLYMSQVVVFFI